MRAISAFTFDRGISTVSCSARCALRMRASMSAMGSVMDIATALPARLGDPRDLAPVGEVPEAQPAHCELAKVGARPPAPLAAVVRTDLELLRSGGLHHQRCFGHER